MCHFCRDVCFEDFHGGLVNFMVYNNFSSQHYIFSFCYILGGVDHARAVGLWYYGLVE